MGRALSGGVGAGEQTASTLYTPIWDLCRFNEDQGERDSRAPPIAQHIMEQKAPLGMWRGSTKDSPLEVSAGTLKGGYQNLRQTTVSLPGAGPRPYTCQGHKGKGPEQLALLLAPRQCPVEMTALSVNGLCAGPIAA